MINVENFVFMDLVVKEQCDMTPESRSSELHRRTSIAR
jgi:hypothetical protein